MRRDNLGGIALRSRCRRADASGGRAPPVGDAPVPHRSIQFCSVILKSQPHAQGAPRTGSCRHPLFKGHLRKADLATRLRSTSVAPGHGGSRAAIRWRVVRSNTLFSKDNSFVGGTFSRSAGKFAAAVRAAPERHLDRSKLGTGLRRATGIGRSSGMSISVSTSRGRTDAYASLRAELLAILSAMVIGWERGLCAVHPLVGAVKSGHRCRAARIVGESADEVDRRRALQVRIRGDRAAGREHRGPT